MGLAATLVALVLAVALAVFANWQERRQRPVGDPPLFSYTAIQMVAIVVAILMAAHLVSLLSGHPLTSRFLR
jgi:ABC-type amino acid transport system permease subunit